MTGRIAQAHDHFFKLLIAEPGAAGALLRERLPPEVVCLLEEGEPAPIPGSFINEHLRELCTDSLFRLRLRGPVPSCLYVIVEHKSDYARRVEFQLLNYENAVWQSLVSRKLVEGAAVTSLVVYHGSAPWSGPERFAAGLTAPAEALARGVDFSIHVFDLGRGDELALSAHPVLRGGLRLLRHGSRHPPEEEAKVLLRSALADLRGASDGCLEAAADCILDRWTNITSEDLIEAVREVLPDKEEAMVSKAAKEFFAEGRAAGRAAGVEEGIAIGEVRGFQKGEASGFEKGEASGFEKGEASGFEKGEASGLEKGAVTGEAKVLVRFLELRFGPLSETQRIRVEHASLSEIEDWTERFFAAKSVADLLGEPT
ncbi:MAG: Rpn family recombination-promoting nuclease/putative transposase [Myxococcales bacterium]|jgi:predicted transposase YdaD